jgi:hypothetical protein
MCYEIYIANEYFIKKFKNITDAAIFLNFINYLFVKNVIKQFLRLNLIKI